MTKFLLATRKTYFTPKCNLIFLKKLKLNTRTHKVKRHCIYKLSFKYYNFAQYLKFQIKANYEQEMQERNIITGSSWVGEGRLRRAWMLDFWVDWRPVFLVFQSVVSMRSIPSSEVIAESLCSWRYNASASPSILKPSSFLLSEVSLV